MKYGWRRDLTDHRDIPFQIPLLGKIDKSSDLQLGFSPVENQEALGSCTGQGFAAILEYNEKVENPYHTDVSRLFIYYNERKLIDEIYNDSGAYIRDGIKAISRWGACDESVWPYDVARFAEEPPPKAYTDGEKRRIKEYRRLKTNNEIRHALTRGMPVVFGFSVFSSFETPQVTSTGLVPMPWKWDRLVGGHCVVMAGHNDETETFKWRNSYGETWGSSGYGFFSYEYARKYASDFWVISP